MDKTTAIQSKNPHLKTVPSINRGDMYPLSMASGGRQLEIIAVKGKMETKKYLAGLGFVAGTKITVVSEMGGSIIVEVKGARMGLSRPMAQRILVA